MFSVSPPIRRPAAAWSLRALEALESRHMMHSGAFPTITIETNAGDITLNMFDERAPQTVQNFLNYAKDGDFINSIFHRVVPGFVVQGGGFRSSAEDLCDCTPEKFMVSSVSAAQFAAVPTDPPVVNEFGHSNVRGTVAMAKLGGNPNSATNQFFFNLANNSSNLDNQNGGFTVFAEIDDMTVVDQIAALPKRNLSSIFPSGSALSALSAVASLTSPTTGHVAAVRMEGFTGTGLVAGKVFIDSNANGESDLAEGGVTRAEVFVDDDEDGTMDVGEAHAVADDLGEYAISLPAGRHVIRPVPILGYTQTDGSAGTGFVINVEIGQGYRERNIGFLYQGGAWQNPRIATDVDGMNGVAPLDALLVINELSDRQFSNAATGALPVVQHRDPPANFLDVTGDNIVAPLDALLVINTLPSSFAAGTFVESPPEGVPAFDPPSASSPFVGPLASSLLDENSSAEESVLDQFFATLGQE